MDMVPLDGDKTIETKGGELTVKVVKSVNVPKVAVIVVLPSPVLTASPRLPTALPTMATFVADEVQLAVLVKNCVVPSL